MTTGNPAIGQDQGVGRQPYTDAQRPRIYSSTLGGVAPEDAPSYRVAAAQAALNASAYTPGNAN